jgi:hemerythrin-like domain-containing protein
MADQHVDAITLLKDDHTKVKKLFRDFEKLTDRAMKGRQDLYMKIRSELEVHTKIEETIFYPAARDVASDMIAEAFEEHRLVAQLLQELGGLDPSDEQFDAKMTVLIENVEHHADEEEKELFPKVKKGLGTERIRELGMQMAERKRELMNGLEAAA